ncbi:response regulator transcription factor [Melittangium boletus]|uniref:Response regulatory domain-containing protein n=1 Tax=Melittangium boletus DSM 14713 TaxID=1294270 RepID=A0A250IH60_9BACT|nr:response regulator [Melittangium boletus]ATB30501.1 hypothetical protein MEBOL_003962 [Melittangium boletus DSM 14713]
MSHILIVEDEDVLADSLQDILLSEGHTVRIARNGLDALELLSQGQTELVLLDLMLPQVDGVSVLQHLRRTSPDTRVIITTSCSREALRGHAVEAYLRKPFTLEALLGAVETALRPKSSRTHTESSV